MCVYNLRVEMSNANTNISSKLRKGGGALSKKWKKEELSLSTLLYDVNKGAKWFNILPKTNTVHINLRIDKVIRIEKRSSKEAY
jgi:hypothetical protein